MAVRAMPAGECLFVLTLLTWQVRQGCQQEVASGSHAWTPPIPKRPRDISNDSSEGPSRTCQGAATSLRSKLWRGKEGCLRSWRAFFCGRRLTPAPLPVGRGEGERTAVCVTQGCARSSLSVPNRHEMDAPSQTFAPRIVIPTGFQFGAKEVGGL